MKIKNFSIRNYFATTFDGMVKGLFSSLIIGVVIKQIGVYTGSDILVKIGQICQYLMGPAIGAGVAYARKSRQFVILSAMVAGAIGAGSIVLTQNANGGFVASIVTGEPVGGFIAALIGIEVGKLIEGRTKFDLLLVPACVILSGGLVGIFISPFMSSFMKWIGNLINNVTVMQPIPSGLLLGLIIGMILSSPISSAGVCIAIGIDGLAAGAAVSGCCAQMIGFAVSSYRENKISGLIGIGIGSSKLLLPNIIKNPWIWVPPSVASAICGVLSTTLFKMRTTSVGAGMGTCALVGPFTTISVMGISSIPLILILNVLIPIVISLIVSEYMRKKNFIKFGDMKLN
ncbi:MAG: PTS sugar transporter subunit IIC [Oscillospiraceae bacterium]|nr:PTS sugar transporter subunit IIC [Oscillospiraceae bacterium]